jgi:hypothetical protein
MTVLIFLNAVNLFVIIAGTRWVFICCDVFVKVSIDESAFYHCTSRYEVKTALLLVASASKLVIFTLYSAQLLWHSVPHPSWHFSHLVVFHGAA